MNDYEVNKIITEFMGRMGFVTYSDELHIGRTIQTHVNYIESLDALIPVWEKLGVKSFRCEKRAKNQFQETKFRFKLYGVDNIARELGLTFQQAAAHATAKAILEISK